MKKTIIRYNTICLVGLLFSTSFILFSCRMKSSKLDVAGGKVIDNTDYPSVVHLNNGGCTGAVISSNTILTAAHCTSAKVSASSHSVAENGTNKQFRAKVVKANPKYRWPPENDRETGQEYSKNDIAVWIFADGTFKNFKDRLQISDVKPKLSDVVRLVGWGCKVYRSGNELKCVARPQGYVSPKKTGTNIIEVVSDDVSYVKLYSDTSIINSQDSSATGEGVLITFGDSGGPLLLNDQPSKIIGVGSYVDFPWDPICNTEGYKDKGYEYKMDCEKLCSGYVNPVSSYNMSLLEEAVDNNGAIIPGVQVGVGVVEYKGKVKVLYKEESTSFNENLKEHAVIKAYNGSSYTTFSSLKKAWRSTNFYERSSASWGFE